MARRNYEIDQGATFDRVYQWIDVDGQPINLTDWTIRASMRPNYTSSQVTNFGTELSSPVSGTFRLVMNATASVSLSAGMYVYDVLAYDGADVRRIMEGTILLRPMVTRI